MKNTANVSTSKKVVKVAEMTPISASKQWRSLVRGEIKLLQRNVTQLFYALIFPILLPFMFLSVVPAQDLPADQKAHLMGTLLAGSIIVGSTMASFYTAVSALVNRREEGVLQRMQAGEASDATIVISIFTPGAVMALLTSCLLFGILERVVGLHISVNLWLVAVGTIAALLVCIAFSLITANYTRTAESAQVTAVPFMLIAMAGTMATVVTKEMSQVLYWIVNALPTAPVAHLIVEGVSLNVDWTIVARSLALAAAWIVLAGAWGWTNLRWVKRS
ncbi:MAG: ABC transporter permease [Actinomycetaceae bacterium]|nr:ABC transporter permease [Actinomycetaceae bacterium]